MLDDCLGSLEEMSKSDSDSNVSQLHSQVSADEQQPESLLLQDLSEGTSADVNEMRFFTDVGTIATEIMFLIRTLSSCSLRKTF